MHNLQSTAVITISIAFYLTECSDVYKLFTTSKNMLKKGVEQVTRTAEIPSMKAM